MNVFLGICIAKIIFYNSTECRLSDFFGVKMFALLSKNKSRSHVSLRIMTGVKYRFSV